MNQFKLISLPYELEALEPVISRKTLMFHHGKHLQAYVNNLNALLPDSGFDGKSLEEIVTTAEGPIFNNAGQILNHNMYFEAIHSPTHKVMPEGKLYNAICEQFGDFESFKDLFSQKGATLFGSGWVWLSVDNEGKLLITQEPNANNPIRNGLHPLLTFDVWEHAYYLDHQHLRADYIKSLWTIINWDVIEKRYEETLQ